MRKIAIAILLGIIITLGIQIQHIKADEQYDILKNLFEMTDGFNSWVNTSGWIEGIEKGYHPCGERNVSDPWYGLRCAGRSVLQIRLQRNGLGGPLPNNIGDLTYVDYMDLSRNHLIGELPASLGKMRQLETLFLTSNALSGKLNPEIWKGIGPALKVLYLNGNHFEGGIPDTFKALTSLQYLDVTMNSMNGVVPNWIGDLPLTMANFGFNAFTGAFPIKICQKALTCAGSDTQTCPDMICRRCVLKTCNCQNVCTSAATCAGGLCGKCVKKGMFSYCS